MATKMLSVILVGELCIGHNNEDLRSIFNFLSQHTRHVDLVIFMGNLLLTASNTVDLEAFRIVTTGILTLSKNGPVALIVDHNHPYSILSGYKNIYIFDEPRSLVMNLKDIGERYRIVFVPNLYPISLKESLRGLRTSLSEDHPRALFCNHPSNQETIPGVIGFNGHPTSNNNDDNQHGMFQVPPFSVLEVLLEHGYEEMQILHSVPLPEEETTKLTLPDSHRNTNVVIVPAWLESLSNDQRDIVLSQVIPSPIQ
jgi:hypothetical protein